ncbi:PEPxxWA-CTERM sorting domain-containing protein [Sphingomonas sp. A2-49]|uniref:PEPxxWA-CTERM sorting domain-containing protein n=1 Tax=Sphingomonas sp. A2-49 TaxID=1391375 RepID=UPI0021CECF23|nr:PEPxxWA-CTERM sorting domain-containing protein [Sphingomonas sp. A2-49]MCU6453891.1 PEPxxWA-CTERM sorting domain-containing protein [Sphingomonas sp. A2-49]
MTFRTVLAIAAAIVPLSAAHADIVTIDFSGTKTSPFATNVVTGRIRYDDRAVLTDKETLNSEFGNQTVASYDDPSGIIEFDINGEQFSSKVQLGLALIDYAGTINDDNASQGYMTFSAPMPSENLVANVVLGWYPSPLAPITQDRTLGETASPFSRPANIKYIWFRTKAGNSAFNTNIDYTVSSVPSVPEPASWALMILGVGMAGAALRQRRASGRIIAPVA